MSELLFYTEVPRLKHDEQIGIARPCRRSRAVPRP